MYEHKSWLWRSWGLKKPMRSCERLGPGIRLVHTHTLRLRHTHVNIHIFCSRGNKLSSQKVWDECYICGLKLFPSCREFNQLCVAILIIFGRARVRRASLSRCVNINTLLLYFGIILEMQIAAEDDNERSQLSTAWKFLQRAHCHNKRWWCLCRGRLHGKGCAHDCVLHNDGIGEVYIIHCAETDYSTPFASNVADKRGYSSWRIMVKIERGLPAAHYNVLLCTWSPRMLKAGIKIEML